MKRKAFMAIAAMLLMSPVAFASSIQDVKPQSSIKDLPKCQPSLSHYTGTVSPASNTESFTVSFSCPQKEDIYATVLVIIDKKRVASAVVKIPAGKISSESTCISLPAGYNGKTYSLLVS